MADYMLGTGVTLTAPFSVLGVPTDPTAVTFFVRDPTNTLHVYVFGVEPNITNPAIGEYVLALEGALLPTVPGHYNWRAEGTGAVVAACEGDFDILPSPTLTITPPTFELGPCTAWVDGGDVADCCSAEVGTDTSLLEGAALAASQVLYELSGRLYSGLCEKTVRPCANGSWCGVQVLSRGHLVGWSDWGGWGWMNGGDWARACGCQPLSRVLLSGYPVTRITEVLIDGQVVDPATYRLDEWRFLSRIRDPADPDTALLWPACQNMDVGDDAEGAFSVTYEYGAQPPLVGIEAAKQLACQIYLGCTNADECQLPIGATRVTRQGITIERQFFQRDPVTQSWRTGLALVDLFLNTVNPQGLRRRPVVWSPSGPRYARPVGTPPVTT